MRVTARGVLGTLDAPVDIFSYGFSMGPEPGGLALTRALCQTFADQLHARFATFTGFSTNQVHFQSCRVASVAAGGLTERDANGSYVQADSAGLPARGTSADLKPLSVAVVISMRSLFDGANGRGRFYMPVPGAVPTADGRLTAINAQTYADKARDLLVGAQADADVTLNGWNVVVASAGSVLKNVPAQLHRVVRAECGDVFDTMRSRRNAIQEARFESVTGF
jgi:hypothetical protein